jgi:hypothetical protein
MKIALMRTIRFYSYQANILFVQLSSAIMRCKITHFYQNEYSLYVFLATISEQPCFCQLLSFTAGWLACSSEREMGNGEIATGLPETGQMLLTGRSQRLHISCLGEQHYGFAKLGILALRDEEGA